MTGTFRPGRRLACVAILAALPLSACAAGYQAETSRVRTSLTSVAGAKGDLTLRNVFFVGPGVSGGALPLYLAIFNGGSTGDQLVSVSSPSAAGGSVPADSALPAGGQIFYNNGDAAVPELTGLQQNFLVGQTVVVTLSFAQTGDVTLTVPIEASGGFAGPSPVPAATVTSAGVPSPSPASAASP